MAYSSMKLELLAVKWVVTEKFRDYLLGVQFVIYTDNNPLSYIQTSAKLTAAEHHWQAELEDSISAFTTVPGDSMLLRTV